MNLLNEDSFTTYSIYLFILFDLYNGTNEYRKAFYGRTKAVIERLMADPILVLIRRKDCILEILDVHQDGLRKCMNMWTNSRSQVMGKYD